MMKKAFYITNIAFLLILVSHSIFAQIPKLNDQEILKAMRDEIARSMNDLHIESLQKPYYIEYQVIIGESAQINAELGNLVSSERNPYARLKVDVRVGDYKFDNSNFFDFGLSFFGSSDDEENFKNKSIAFQPDYASLRRNLWLSTDAAYKQAAEIYSKKVASLKNRNRKDTTHDFIKITPSKYFTDQLIPDFSVNQFEDICKSVSKVFLDFPEIQKSSVGFEYLPQRVYMVNSEGREYIKNEAYTGFEVVAYTQAEDGMPLANYFTAHSIFPNNLPKADSLIKSAKLIADKLSDLRKAITLDESYSGPILFAGIAAPQIIANVFAPNLAVQREPLTEGGFSSEERHSAFQSKIGGRVLPEFLSLKAIPNATKYDNTSLIGNFELDDDGVKPQEVELVVDGFLKTLLSSRVPNKRVRNTNGHKRGGAAMISNLIVEASDDEKILSYIEQKEKMIKLCKDRELEYGIVIKKVLDQNILFTTLLRITSGDFPFTGLSTKVPITEAYKLYPDGTEVLLRGVDLKGISVQSFKDILSVSKDKYSMNYLAPSITSPFVSGGSQFIGASIIAPNLLFEDGELVSVEEDYPKPPITGNPLRIK